MDTDPIATWHRLVASQDPGGLDAMLEFETVLDGITVNGVDIIKWNGDGKVVDFKVMVRPLKAINLIHQKMGAMLAGGAR